MRIRARAHRVIVSIVGVFVLLPSVASIALCEERATLSLVCSREDAGESSIYEPVDSWIYPAMLRLYGLGYIRHEFLGLRPWTRESIVRTANEVAEELTANPDAPQAEEARAILDRVRKDIVWSSDAACLGKKDRLRVESVYNVIRGVDGVALTDSFHLGQTVVNDYGRPVEEGANNYTGASGSLVYKRFALYVRGENEVAPSFTGYSAGLAQQLSNIDLTSFINQQTGLPNVQSTIPYGAMETVRQGRVVEAYLSTKFVGHVFSFGKQDEWWGPGVGAAMAYSNNAENVYAFHVNRTDGLHIPYLSRVTGPFRYEFLVGPTKGHNEPLDPWVHAEKISFRPTENLEFGFERTVLWGGKGHTPITIHSFLKSFFSVQNVTSEEKNSREDPGARFGAFDFSYRLPGVRNWLTFYADSEAHDDVSPISAPRRAAYRPGIYLSHFPKLSKLDLRAEAANTDASSRRSIQGQFQYWEGIEKQGYTNNGQLFGDWIGREDKGGQAWLTYHLSGNEWLQASVRTQKATKDFIPGGTTLNDISFEVVKRFKAQYELKLDGTVEHWKAPIYLSGEQTVGVADVEIRWYPKFEKRF